MPEVSLIQAQVIDNSWSPPYRLSTEAGKASNNTMVADQYGFVHVFWVETGFPDNRSVIQYARFDGNTWSRPLDIYVSQPGITVGRVSPFVDQDGTLHLAWTEGIRGPVYYTKAPAYDALSAHHWQRPIRVDIPAYWVKLLVDSEGTVHILYDEFTGSEKGVYYLHSEDQGINWSQAIWLDPDIPENLSPTVLQFGLDANEGLHAVWEYIMPDNRARGQWIRYAHSLDGGKNWSVPITIDQANSEGNGLPLPYPGLAIHGQTVHVVWAGDDQTHREHRFSMDAGQTWSAPKRIFGDLLGQARGDGLAVDAAGRVHFVGQIRSPQGLYHAYWDQGHWSVPSLFYLISRGASDPIGNRIHAHDVRLAIRAGNQLVITFSNAGPVLYAMHRIPNDTATLHVVPTPVSTPTSKPSPTSIAVARTPTPEMSRMELGAVPPPANPTASSNVVWLAVVPSMILVIVTVVFQVLLRRRL
jgi:hypothetical protein